MVTYAIQNIVGQRHTLDENYNDQSYIADKRHNHSVNDHYKTPGLSPESGSAHMKTRQKPVNLTSQNTIESSNNDDTKELLSKNQNLPFGKKSRPF